MGWGGGQGGCEWKSKAFVKIQKKKIEGGWRSGQGGGVGFGGGGVRVDENGEVKLVGQFKKKKIWGGVVVGLGGCQG